MTIKKIIILLSLSIFTNNLLTAQTPYNAYQAPSDPIIDGNGVEAIWPASNWKAIDQLWLGASPSSSDFLGRYKVCWRGTKIFILAEITDNTLYDGHTDPLVQWYDDDCVEIFIDEDQSKGNHQCTYNAFAYHVATNFNNVDLGTDCNPHLYNSHISSARTVSGNTYTWEIAMTIYGSSYTDAGPNTPVNLTIGKVSGFSIAYCDNDGSANRESFIGSEVMPAGHNNDNYITADYFGTLNLIGPNPTLGLNESEINVIHSNGQLNINVLGDIKNYILSIYDLKGTECYKNNLIYNQLSANNNLKSGLYIIVIQSEEKYFQRKIVID